MHTNRKFERRFKYIELELKRQKKEISDASLGEMKELWQEAKNAALD